MCVFVPGSRGLLGQQWTPGRMDAATAWGVAVAALLLLGAAVVLFLQLVRRRRQQQDLADRGSVALGKHPNVVRTRDSGTSTLKLFSTLKSLNFMCKWLCVCVCTCLHAFLCVSLHFCVCLYITISKVFSQHCFGSLGYLSLG